MGKELLCLRCGTEMRFMMRERLQLGQTGWLLGDLSNLLSGSLKVDVYCCPDCGKMEFFKADDNEPGYDEAEDRIAQVRCPKCGTVHDMDYPKCPKCKYNYEEN